MPEEPISFDDICRYVGHLYLQSRHQIERLSASAGGPVLQSLRDQLLASQKKIAELESRPHGGAA